MSRYHPEVGQDQFRRLQQGELPTGAWKYCSNWEHIWEDGFVAEDEEVKMNN